MKETTKALTELELNNIDYKLHEYPSSNGPVAAIDVANYMGFSVDRLVKTLVTTDHHGGYYVFCLPAANKIHLKKAAQFIGVRNLTMLQSEMFEELTGYVHGGCSPFGLKTKLPVYVEEKIFKWDTIYLSGGRIGLTIEINPRILQSHLDAHIGNFTH